ncbi:MAG: peroxide stress protein YaaA [Mycobacteriales bacterium]
MLLLLPPSEGKATGGRGPRLDLDALSFPQLRPQRARLIQSLETLARTDPQALRRSLQLAAGTPAAAAAVAADAMLGAAPTRPALELYRGVLFEALDYGSLRAGALRRANRSVLVASALFGLVRPQDRLPPYRLSASSVLPAVGPLVPFWRPALAQALAQLPVGPRNVVVDLRSGAYRALYPVARAVEVRVLRDRDGTRSVVSHDNKHTKGRLARVLCEHGATSVSDVAEAGRVVADVVEVSGSRVDLVLYGLASARPDHTRSG